MKTFLRLLPALALTSLIILSTHFYILLFSPPEKFSPTTIEFRHGAGLGEISEALKEKGIIRSPRAFRLLAALKGSTRRLKAGEYEFPGPVSAAKVLEKLEKGLVKMHAVTIPEGYNIREIAGLLEMAGLSQKERFIEKATDRDFLISVGIDAKSAEGYLFPDTYLFSKGTPDEAMIKTMTGHFQNILNYDLREKARANGLSIDALVTLASIVEKETGTPHERPLIARVFLNRLKIGIPLQSDPTVIYGIKDFNGNLTKRDLLTDTPYNTYRRKGLPAGPVSNPGLASIRAVLYPADGSYLYFVSRNDGTHHFSKTLSEHNKAVKTYQLRGRGKKT